MKTRKMKKTSRIELKEWPLDLLVDYAIKLHHRTIRRQGPQTLALLRKVSDEHAVASRVADLFAASLQALNSHLMKEEHVLFPFLYELFEAYEGGGNAAPMHCGTISNPIRVMMMEHDNELERHRQIELLTDGYTAPADASDDYQEALRQLREFRDALLEHIYVENDLVFPGFEAVERQVVSLSMQD